jgi:hypothetical protein
VLSDDGQQDGGNQHDHGHAGEQPSQAPERGDKPKLDLVDSIAERDAHLFLPAGAIGQGAIYTEHGTAIQILRKVILRVGAKLDYLILKLH